MPDMLVKLYELPEVAPTLVSLHTDGIGLRRPLAPEKHLVVNWVHQHFRQIWASECEVAFTHHPPSCFIAVAQKQLLGFACYNTTRKGFFGPVGVAEPARGRGIGKALLLVCLQSMWHEGYGYAIIGGAGPTTFYEQAVGAIPIAGSWPGIYRGALYLQDGD
jgi:GNAT superfamily N-acetyltransferase